jgi:hypothetical protein
VNRKLSAKNSNYGNKVFVTKNLPISFVVYDVPSDGVNRLRAED